MSRVAEPPAAGGRLFTAPYLTLWITNFFLILGTSVFVLLPHYLMLRGTSEVFYGAVSGTVGLASFACGITLGHWGDRWGRKRAFNFYLVPALLGSLLAVLAIDSAPAWYFLVRMLHGFTLGLGFPIVVAWVVEMSPAHRRTEALAYFGLSGLISGTLGPFLGELMLAAGAVKTGAESGAGAYLPVFGMALAALLVASAIVQFVPSRPAAFKDSPPSGGLLRLLTWPAPRVLLAIVVNFGGVSFVLIFFGKTFAAHLGLDYATVFFGAFTVGAVASRVAIRAILARVSQSHLIVAALLGIGVAFSIAAFARGYPGLALAGLVYGICHGVLYPSLNIRFLEFFSPRELGRAATLFASAFALGTGVYPYIGGYLLEKTSFTTLFLVAGTLAVSSLGLHFWVEREMRRGAKG